MEKAVRPTMLIFIKALWFSELSQADKEVHPFPHELTQRYNLDYADSYSSNTEK